MRNSQHPVCCVNDARVVALCKFVHNYVCTLQCACGSAGNTTSKISMDTDKEVLLLHCWE